MSHLWGFQYECTVYHCLQSFKWKNKFTLPFFYLLFYYKDLFLYKMIHFEAYIAFKNTGCVSRKCSKLQKYFFLLTITLAGCFIWNLRYIHYLTTWRANLRLTLRLKSYKRGLLYMISKLSKYNTKCFFLLF